MSEKAGVVFLTTYVPNRRIHWPHLNAWLVALGIVFLLAVAVGAGVLIGRSTKHAEPIEGLAPKLDQKIDEGLATLNRGDWKAFAAGWTKNAMLEDAPLQTRDIEQHMVATRLASGRQQIVDITKAAVDAGARYYRASPVIQSGRLAAYVVVCPCRGLIPGGTTGIDIVEFAPDGKVEHLWTGINGGPAPSR